MEGKATCVENTGENTVVLLAAAGGCTGALAGMLMFRHKTRKLKFMIELPVIFVVESIFFVYIFLKLDKLHIE